MGFVFEQAGDMTEASAMQWLIEGILPERGLAMLFGRGGSLKSSVSLDMMLHLAYGLPWHGHAVKPVAGLFIAAEKPDLTRQRSVVWLAEHGLKPSPQARILTAAPNFRDQKTVETLVHEMRQARLSVGFIVVDSLSATWGAGQQDGEMSNPTEAYRYFDGIKRLSDAFGASVLVIHHENKQGKMRDAEAFRDIVDTQIRATYLTKSGMLRLECTKQNAAPLFQPVTLAVTTATASVGRQHFTAPVLSNGAAKSTPATDDMQVLRLIARAGGQMTTTEVSRKLGWSDRTGRRRVRRLLDNGWLRAEGVTRDRFLSLTPEGWRLVSAKAE